MNAIEETLSRVEELLKGEGFVFSDDVTSKFDRTNDFDVQNLGYLNNDPIGSGGYNQWLALLLRESDAKVILELGNRYGVSTIAMYDSLKRDQTLISVDTERDQRYVPDSVFTDSRVHIVYGDCLNPGVFRKDGGKIPIDIDIVFTDTIHFYEQVKAEFSVYEPLLADEALFVIDDINLNDKGRFFQESPYSRYDLTCFCHVSGFGAIHYVRPEHERGRSNQERIFESMLRSSEALSKLYFKSTQKVEALERKRKRSLKRALLRRVPILGKGR